MNPTSNEHAISIPNTLRNQPPSPPPPPPLQPVLPCCDLLLGSREEYIRIGVPLYEASIKGDWNAAENILEERPELVRFSITENYDTALHIAASAKNTKKLEEFVRNLVNLMEKKDLQLQNNNSNTALCLAAAAGHVKMAEIMVTKNSALLSIPGSQGMMPLYMAALFAKHDMVKYLYNNSQKMTGDFWTQRNRGWVLLKCVEADMFDFALQIVKDIPYLAESRSIYQDVLLVLARKTDAYGKVNLHIILRIIKSIFAVIHLKVKMGPFEKESDALQLLRIIWKNIANLPKREIDTILRGPPDSFTKDKKPIISDKEDQALQLLRTISENIAKLPAKIYNLIRGPDAPNMKAEEATTSKGKKEKYSSRVLFVATEMGNTTFIVELIRLYPDVIWKVNDHNQSIFHVAILHRQKDIYNLLYDIGSMKDLITPLKDENDNTMLHLVGEIAQNKQLPNVSGVALQMQRELSWFKEIEAMIPPSYRQRKNKDGLTPYELFTKKHDDLAAKGEKWMKETAAQCMVVAALIATVVFAAAFTVPGGYDQNTGLPMFLHNHPFIVFVISDAISLVSASTSILMFLSILTSRYAQHDFFETLPKKLMIGLTTLFLSIASMMIAFSVSFFVLYHKQLIWIPIFISAFAAIPVILFAKSQYPLLADVFRSTYGSTYLFKSRKIQLYDS